MLRIIQKDNLLYLTEQERTEYDQECTTLIYTLPDLSLSETVKGRVRPFRALWLEKKEMYKLSLLDYLPDILYSGPPPVPTSLEEHKQTIDRIKEIVSFMGLEWCDVSGVYDIRYECDTWNSIEDSYGRKLSLMLKTFLVLPKEEQELVRRVWLALENKRSDVARTGNWRDIIDLLPEKTQTELIIFGEESEVGGEGSLLEFRNKEQLGPRLPNLRDLVYQEFRLGEFLMEGAQDIKDRLEKIYQVCGIDRKPKAKDLEEWFVVVPCRKQGRRGFRIDFRK